MLTKINCKEMTKEVLTQTARALRKKGAVKLGYLKYWPIAFQRIVDTSTEWDIKKQIEDAY